MRKTQKIVTMRASSVNYLGRNKASGNKGNFASGVEMGFSLHIF